MFEEDDLVPDSELLSLHFGDPKTIGQRALVFEFDRVFEIFMFGVQSGNASIRVHDFSHCSNLQFPLSRAPKDRVLTGPSPRTTFVVETAASDLPVRSMTWR